MLKKPSKNTDHCQAHARARFMRLLPFMNLLSAEARGHVQETQAQSFLSGRSVRVWPESADLHDCKINLFKEEVVFASFVPPKSFVSGRKTFR